MRTIGKFIDLQVLGLPKPTLRDVIQIAATINRRSALPLLGQINLLLSTAAITHAMEGDSKARARVQEMLLRDTISQRRLDQIRGSLPPPAPLNEWALFHRRQVLASIKLVALYGQSSGGNKLDSRDGLDALAELALHVNSLNDFGAFPQQHSAALCELAAQLAPAVEFDNLPRIDNAFARNRRMLQDLLALHQTPELARHLDRLFVVLTGGLSLETYRDLTFGLWAYCQSLSTTSILDFQGRAFFNPHGGTPFISPVLYEQLFRNIALDIDALPTAIGPIRNERELLLDHTIFRRYPVWRHDPEHYLCIDSYLLADKLAAGLYWSINHALESDCSVTGDFSSLWGMLVEDHVLDVLDYAVAPTAARLVKNPRYEKKEDEEAFDAMVLDGRHAVVFQVKGLFARANLKYSGRGNAFFKGLTEKFGNVPGAATYQLSRNIRLTFGIPKPRRLRNLVLDDVRCVWPVVVVLDPILDFELSCRVLAQRFERRAAKIIPRADLTTRPVVFMQVEDIEMLAQHVRDRDFTLVECLQQKSAEDPGHGDTFGAFFEQRFKPSRGLAFKKNAAISRIWEETSEQAMEHFSTGAYRGCTQTPHGAVFPRS